MRESIRLFHGLWQHGTYRERRPGALLPYDRDDGGLLEYVQTALVIRLNLDKLPGLYRNRLKVRTTTKMCRERPMSVPVSGRTKLGHIRATIAAALAAFIFPAGVAHAQFWPQGAWWGDPFRPRHHYRHSKHARSVPAKPESVKNAQSNDAPKGPLQIIVSIADQQVSLYDNGTLIARSPVSTGTPHHPTPLGVFSVIEKQRWHRSNLYSAAPMPYMQRITWSGVALHAGVVPGHPASHGCIRLKNGFAVQLWGITKRGTRVIVARDDVEPVAIANPHLFKPKAASPSPDLQAAVLKVKLPHLLAWTQARRRVAAQYDEMLAEIGEVLTPKVAPDRDHVYHLYVIRTDQRDSLKKHLGQVGISTALNYPKALPFYPAYAYLRHAPEEFPVAYANQSRILSLPIYPEMTGEMVASVVDQTKRFFDNRVA